MKKIISIHSALLVPLSLLFWWVAYPHTLLWMEEYSFFSTAPDFMLLQVRMPADALKYAGAFVLQFYGSPLTGALLQTLFAWIVMVCADVVAQRVLRRERLMWTAMVPVAVFVALQCGYRDLEVSLMWCIGAVAAAVAAAILVPAPAEDEFAAASPRPAKRGRAAEAERKSGRALDLATRYLLPVALLAAGMYVSYADKECRVRERIHEAEHLAEAKEWDRLLEIVTPEVAAQDPVRRRYALLALCETGRLADRMFEYGITSPDDMFFPHSTDFIGLYFNSLLYENLGIDNEVVHIMYLLNEHSVFGFSQRTLRRMTDAFLRQGDAVLAEKYLRVLSHSLCNRRWVCERMERLDALRRYGGGTDAFVQSDVYVGSQTEAPILMDMYNLLELEPSNRKYADLLLCGFLAGGLLDDFERMFAELGPRFYAEAKELPRHYEEALWLISLRNPELSGGYAMNPARGREFEQFTKLMNKGLRGSVKQKWPDSFWAYMYCE